MGLLLAQTVMETTEVIHRSQQIHPPFQSGLMMSQGATTTHQGVQTGPEGGIEALDLGSVEYLSFWQESLLLVFASLYEASLYFYEPSGFMTLDDLSDHHRRPGQQSRTPNLAGVHRSAKDAPPGFDITDKAIGDE